MGEPAKLTNPALVPPRPSTPPATPPGPQNQRRWDRVDLTRTRPIDPLAAVSRPQPEKARRSALPVVAALAVILGVVIALAGLWSRVEPLSVAGHLLSALAAVVVLATLRNTNRKES